MHQSDKVGKSALGELVRMRKGSIIINPFLEGQQLLQKQRDQVKYLSSSFNHHVEFTNFLLNQPGTPIKTLNDDKNKTRVTSIYELQKSNLFMKKPLSEHFLNKNIWPFLNVDDWKLTKEVEGVLYIQQVLTTLSQNEQKMNGAYVGVIKKRTHEKLSAELIDLIKLDEWKRYVLFHAQI